MRGPDAYVSPGWYPSKAEHGRVVPTWSVDDAPERFVDGQLRAVVGVEVVVTRVEAKARLSQNRPAGDIDGVVAGLTAAGAPASADAVRKPGGSRERGGGRPGGDGRRDARAGVS